MVQTILNFRNGDWLAWTNNEDLHIGTKADCYRALKAYEDFHILATGREVDERVNYAPSEYKSVFGTAAEREKEVEKLKKDHLKFKGAIPLELQLRRFMGRKVDEDIISRIIAMVRDAKTPRL